MTGAVSTTGFPPRFILMDLPGRREALNDVQRRVVGTGLLLSPTITIGDSPLVGRFDHERRVVPGSRRIAQPDLRKRLKRALPDRPASESDESA